MDPERVRSSVTLRAVVIGAILIPITCMWVIQAEILWYSGQPTTISLFSHVVFIIFFITILNLGVKKLSPQTALNPGELLTIYIMLCLASVVCGHDMIEILVPILSHPYRFATPENQWAETFHKFLPSHLLVNKEEIFTGAYEGGSSMYRWEVVLTWGKPLLLWASFIFALILSLFLLNLILRKQWTENEKLSYPVIQLPLELTTRTKELLSSRLLWYGLAIAAGIDLLNGLSYYYPAIPNIPVVTVKNLGDYFTERPWNAMGRTPISFYPFAIGLCFFLPLDLAFSCWFFFIFWKAERILTSALGLAIPGAPFITEQTSGGYIGLCIIAIWISRRYLREVGKKILGMKSELDDRDEPLSYRKSLAGIILCLLYLSFFMKWMGMSLWLVFPFLLIYFAIAIAIARMRAELGPPAHDLVWGGPDMILVKSIGSRFLTPLNLAALSLCAFFNRAYRGHPMAHSLEGLKIAERTKVSSRRLLWAMIAAIILGIFAAYWALLHIFYKYGISAGIIGPGFTFGDEPCRHLNSWLRDPRGPNWWMSGATIWGIFSVLILAFLRMRFVWWPFHPIGFAVSGSWSMEQLWFPIFLSWLIKSITLRYGGAKAYRPAIPFFIGLVLGEFIVGSFWSLWGIIRGIPTYHFWPY